ncbi:unnamed protein product [Vitrella brassicaformis CCMP3155]|uniref:Uncharacterized protein n=1 Tax=Vitrella brassicaformis (strain CCMP3155) TaxID=1169540 RepID=A0A0G4FT47_VITBC|nr:unnamed protein product [Vitrella brassicaformis CCMP3155]|eukprot:CEM17857.1 unnamed protein product [Vitrella brassicaformis CCMP3155]
MAGPPKPPSDSRLSPLFPTPMGTAVGRSRSPEQPFLPTLSCCDLSVGPPHCLPHCTFAYLEVSDHGSRAFRLHSLPPSKGVTILLSPLSGLKLGLFVKHRHDGTIRCFREIILPSAKLLTMLLQEPVGACAVFVGLLPPRDTESTPGALRLSDQPFTSASIFHLGSADVEELDRDGAEWRTKARGIDKWLPERLPEDTLELAERCWAECVEAAAKPDAVKMLLLLR